MIKNLIFDFGRVLVDYDFKSFIDPLFDNRADADEFFRLICLPGFMDECDRGSIPFGELIAGFERANPQYALQARIFYERFNDIVTGEVPGMYELLSELKGKGYKLYGLTNWCSKVYEIMKIYPIFSLLDGQIVSSDEHLIKPEAAIYQRLCDKYGIKAEESLFTDDKPVNIEGSEAIGMRGIVFQSAEQYREELKRYL